MPVEYKHGSTEGERRRPRCSSARRRCALEEMLVCEIPCGALFYAETHRRELVELTPELRQKTLKMAAEMNDYFVPRLHAKGQTRQVTATPAPSRNSACPLCIAAWMRRHMSEHTSKKSQRKVKQIETAAQHPVCAHRGQLSVVGRRKCRHQPGEEGGWPLPSAHFRKHPLLLLSRRLPCPDGGLRRSAASIWPSSLRRGSFWPVSWAKRSGNVLLRQQQYRAADDPFASCRYRQRHFCSARSTTLAGYWSGQPATIPSASRWTKLKSLSQNLAAALPNIENAVSLEELRGLEGAAAQQYFDGFDEPDSAAA